MIRDIEVTRSKIEILSLQHSKQYDELYQTSKNIQLVSQKYAQNAKDGIKAWWDLSDYLMLKYADGFCDGCPVRSEGYPSWWLQQVGYQDGPPDSPPVPPYA